MTASDMLERFRRTPKPIRPETPEKNAFEAAMTRRELLLGGMCTVALAQVPPFMRIGTVDMLPKAGNTDTPLASPKAPTTETAKDVATEDIQSIEQKHGLSTLGYAVIAEQMASFAQIIKQGTFTPYTSGRSIANLAATKELLNRVGNEADREMGAEMWLEFTGERGLNLGLACALPYITNMTKYMKVMAGNLVTGLPPEVETDEKSIDSGTHQNNSWAKELLHPHDISRDDQDAINSLFPALSAGSEKKKVDIAVSSITAQHIDELVQRLHNGPEASSATGEAMSKLEGVLESKLKQLIGRGLALVDVVAPLGTTYLSTQIGNELASEVLEYKYRLEYVRQIKQHKDELATLDTSAAFEFVPSQDTVAPPSHLQEGLHVLEYEAILEADRSVNSIRGLLGARIARGANGSGILLAGDPPLPFAYSEAAKRGVLPKLVAKTVEWGSVDTISNGLLTSVQLAHRIIGRDGKDEIEHEMQNRFGTAHAYISGATIMSQKVGSGMRNLRPSLRKINNGTAVRLDMYNVTPDEPEAEISATDYSRQIEAFLTDIQNGADPNVIMPILKIMRQSIIGGYNSISEAVTANAQILGTKEGREQFVKSYLKLIPPPHEPHHQEPDDLILQDEEVTYSEIASRLESWPPHEQLRYIRSIMYRYLEPEDLADGSPLGALFSDNILTNHTEIAGYTSLMHDTANEFVDMLRGYHDSEDAPITARSLAPEIKQVFSRFAQTEQVHAFLQLKPPIAQDKLGDLARAKAGYDLPYGELREWSENAQEVFFALTTQLPHVGAIVESAKLILEGFDKTLNRMGADVKVKANLKLALNTMLVMGVSSVADNVAAFLFGLTTGELIVDDMVKDDPELSESHAADLKFAAMMTALSAAIHAGQNLLPGNGPNFSASRPEPDVGKLIAIGTHASRIGQLDQTAHSLPLIDVNEATDEQKERMKQAKRELRTRGPENGFVRAVRIHKVEGWSARQYQRMFDSYGLYMSEDRIERFILGHTEDEVILIPRPGRLENGSINTHPVSMNIKESVQTTRNYPVQGLAAPIAWLGDTMRAVHGS
jgi:ribosomal protein L12E/L44/L45/RPP1/RPP2